MRPTLSLDLTPVLSRGPVLLRAPQSNDYQAWAELRAASRAHLTPFEPLWSSEELSRGAFRERLRRYQRDARDELGYAFFIFCDQGHTLVGGISLANVRRGVTQAANIGYWIGLPHTRKGYVSAALAAVADYAFDELRLHRLEAACMPANAPSLKVLANAGFRQEGLARKLLCINGTWEDHILHALLAEDHRA